MKHETGGTRWPSGNILMQTNCLDITMARKTSCKDVATRVGRFALRIILCLGLGEATHPRLGGRVVTYYYALGRGAVPTSHLIPPFPPPHSPLSPSNDAPATNDCARPLTATSVFHVSGPQLWNQLPAATRATYTDTQGCFKRALKVVFEWAGRRVADYSTSEELS